MVRLLAVVTLALLWIAGSAGAQPTLGRTIDLNAPGALEALQQTNPTHYEKVRKIIDGVIHQPDADVPRWMHVTFAARDVSYAPIVLTSHPPQRRLSFALDVTRYVAVVTLTNVRRDIVPAR